MLKLSGIKPKIRRKAKKRVGRGAGSGTGTYSGRGLKGQKARSGGRIRPGFEGGRMPFIRQIPKLRGFRSHRPACQVIGLLHLEKLFSDGDRVTPKALLEKGLITNTKIPVKVLSNGTIKKKLVLKDILISAGAKSAIEAVGGSIEQKENAK